MTDKACATCAKHHPADHGELECRAHPPHQDVARFGRFPVVKADDYCWEFEADRPAKAKPAAKAAAAGSKAEPTT